MKHSASHGCSPLSPRTECSKPRFATSPTHGPAAEAVSTLDTALGRGPCSEGGPLITSPARTAAVVMCVCVVGTAQSPFGRLTTSAKATLQLSCHPSQSWVRLLILAAPHTFRATYKVRNGGFPSENCGQPNPP